MNRNSFLAFWNACVQARLGRLLMVVFGLILIFSLVSCATMGRERVLDAYTVAESYLQQYKAQRKAVDGTPLATELDEKVWPITEQALDALDAWEAVTAGDATWEAKKATYLRLNAQMLSLFLKYGVIEIEED